MSDSIVVSGSAAWPQPTDHPVVTIGNFDGVHLGHRALVREAVCRAQALGVPACVYTFDPAPRDVLRPGNPIKRIQSLDDRVALLGSLGVDRVIVEPFTRAFGAHGAQWFADEVLTRRIGPSAVVVGWDFRFGAGREGTVEALREWMPVPVVQVDALALDDGVISSSRIREALNDGDIAQANRLLDRPHIIHAEVVHGHARGRSLGIRTANLADCVGLTPGSGVYAVRVRSRHGTHLGVANIGERPTFNDAGSAVEVHVLDLDADLYGQTLTVSWEHRLRDEQRFDSTAELVAQIQQDIATAREQLA